MSQERSTSQSFGMKNALDVLRVRLNAIGPFDQYNEKFFFFPHDPYTLLEKLKLNIAVI